MATRAANRATPLHPTPAVQTIGDLLAFFALHDTYHIGQLAYAPQGARTRRGRWIGRDAGIKRF